MSWMDEYTTKNICVKNVTFYATRPTTTTGCTKKKWSKLKTNLIQSIDFDYKKIQQKKLHNNSI